MIPAYRLFQTSPLSANFDVSTIIVWVVEECNGIDFSLLTFLLHYWVFERFFEKHNHSFTPPYDLSSHSVCMYHYPGIASFHPTSKDSSCGAHGRRFGSMHCFTYCKIKEWIHGDDTSYELIKIAQVYEKWMIKIKKLLLWNPLSFIWKICRHGYISFLFSLFFCFFFFFFTMLLSMFFFI
jgi:hypothetical protein